jgi:hypothetical protein
MKKVHIFRHRIFDQQPVSMALDHVHRLELVKKRVDSWQAI